MYPTPQMCPPPHMYCRYARMGPTHLFWHEHGARRLSLWVFRSAPWYSARTTNATNATNSWVLSRLDGYASAVCLRSFLMFYFISCLRSFFMSYFITSRRVCMTCQVMHTSSLSFWEGVSRVFSERALHVSLI